MRFDLNPPLIFTYLCKIKANIRAALVIAAAIFILFALIPWNRDSSSTYKNVALPNSTKKANNHEQANNLQIAKSNLTNDQTTSSQSATTNNTISTNVNNQNIVNTTANSNLTSEKSQTLSTKSQQIKHSYLDSIPDVPHISSSTFQAHKNTCNKNNLDMLQNSSNLESQTKNISNNSSKIQSLQKVSTKVNTVSNFVEQTNLEKENWSKIKVKSGDTLTIIFKKIGLSQKELHNILSDKIAKKHLTKIKPGQTLSFFIEKDANNTNNAKRLKSLKLDISPTKFLSIICFNNTYKTVFTNKQINVVHKFKEAVIKNSLFEAASKQKINHKLIMQLVEIFSWDIDFALDIRKNDSFKILYEEKYVDGKKIATGNILAATFYNKKKVFNAIRYEGSNNSGNNYFTPDGYSMQKAFLRSPVKFTKISSKFTYSRKHPILHKIRAHKGVDYVAPRGTPIKASGDGKIIHIGRKGGYGKAIILQHGQKYTTLYGHLSGYANNLRNGSYVKQGQTIGFLGSTGLASGPHLHYEFRVNGVHKDPLKVKLPKSTPIPRNKMRDFTIKANKILAELDSFNNSKSKLAQN